MSGTSGTTVDTTQLRKAANLLYYDADKSAPGTGSTDNDACGYLRRAKDAVSGVMVPVATTTPLPPNTAVGPAGTSTTWIPLNHGSISQAVYDQLAAAMDERDTAATNVAQACQDLAAALRKAAQMYEDQDEANQTQINNNDTAEKQYHQDQQQAQDDYDQAERDYLAGQ